MGSNQRITSRHESRDYSLELRLARGGPVSRHHALRTFGMAGDKAALFYLVGGQVLLSAKVRDEER